MSRACVVDPRTDRAGRLRDLLVGRGFDVDDGWCGIDNRREGAREDLVGLFAAIEPARPEPEEGWHEAKPGSWTYLLRVFFAGALQFRAGPAVIYGSDDRDRANAILHATLGIPSLDLPGLRYAQVQRDGSLESLLTAFAAAAEEWERHAREYGMAPHERRALLARNRALASLILGGIRGTARPLAHRLNRIGGRGLPADAVPNLPHGLSQVERLTGPAADSLLRWEGDGSATAGGLPPPSRFCEFAVAFRTSLADGEVGAGVGSIARAVQALRQLEALVAWWESLIAWGGIAATVGEAPHFEGEAPSLDGGDVAAAAGKEPHLEVVVVDDDVDFCGEVLECLSSKDFARELQGRRAEHLWPVHATAEVVTDPKAADQIVRAVRERGLHAVEMRCGRPVVVLQDLAIGDHEDLGLTMIRRLRARYPWIRIVAFTARERAHFAALDAGADLYLAKTEWHEHSTRASILAEVLVTVTAPSALLQIGHGLREDDPCVTLLCRRYGLDAVPVRLEDPAGDAWMDALPREAGPPRLLVITGEEPNADPPTPRTLSAVRRLCLLFPDMAVLLFGPAGGGAQAAAYARRWFATWARWIPDFPTRVVPVGRSSAEPLSPPRSGAVLVPGDSQGAGDLRLLLSAQELEALGSLLGGSATLRRQAVFEFLVPRPHGERGEPQRPGEAEMDRRITRKAAEWFGGCSTHEVKGRWLDAQGEMQLDWNLALEAFAFPTRASRDLARAWSDEIRAELGEESVLQIERPIAVLPREAVDGEPPLPASLCAEPRGVVDGRALLGDILRAGRARRSA